MNAVATTMRDPMCACEDRRGVRCVYGVGHKVKCCFRRIEWTAEYLDALRRLTDNRNGVEVFGADTTLRTLVGRGFAQRGFIGQRFWRYWITAAGRRVLVEAAR